VVGLQSARFKDTLRAMERPGPQRAVVRELRKDNAPAAVTVDDRERGSLEQAIRGRIAIGACEPELREPGPATIEAAEQHQARIRSQRSVVDEQMEGAIRRLPHVLLVTVRD